jgi:hypothetical protein
MAMVAHAPKSEGLYVPFCNDGSRGTSVGVRAYHQGVGTRVGSVAHGEGWRGGRPDLHERGILRDGKAVRLCQVLQLGLLYDHPEGFFI